MYPYRKILELNVDDISLRNIAMMTNHSLQKITVIIALVKQKGVKIQLEEEIADPWLDRLSLSRKETRSKWEAFDGL